MSRQPPTQQAPPVMRMRIQYAKRGRLRFTSHRDFSRAFERAVFRAGLPMSYSSGFNPHPRISYAGASPTGAASEAEYLEIALADVVECEQVHQALDESLPPGLDILRVVVGPGGSLADRLTASRWLIEVDWPRDVAEQAVAAFLAAESVPTERMTKKGLREFDARASVRILELTQGLSQWVGISAVIEHSAPLVRPDDLVRAMGVVGERELSPPMRLTRVEQGFFDGEKIMDPLISPEGRPA